MTSTKFRFTLHIDHRMPGDDEDTRKNKRNKFYEEKENWQNKEWREKLWKQLSELGVKFIWCQMEVGGKTDRTHIQGYIEYNKKTTAFKIAGDLRDTKLYGANYDVCKGTAAQNIVYCGKEDTRIDGPWTHGKVGKERQGERTDLDGVKEMAKNGASPNEIARAEPTIFIKYCKGIEKLCDAYNEEYSQKWTVEQRLQELQVHCIWGKAGAGKTRQVYESHPMREIYSLRRANGGNTWFDGYHRQKVLLIDEFKGWIPLGLFLKLLDIYPIQTDKKGGFCYNNWNTVYVISNRPPKEWYPNMNKEEKSALVRRFTTITEVSSDDTNSSKSSGNDEESTDEDSSEAPNTSFP